MNLSPKAKTFSKPTYNLNEFCFFIVRDMQLAYFVHLIFFHTKVASIPVRCLGALLKLILLDVGVIRGYLLSQLLEAETNQLALSKVN